MLRFNGQRRRLLQYCPYVISQRYARWPSGVDQTVPIELCRLQPVQLQSATNIALAKPFLGSTGLSLSVISERWSPSASFLHRMGSREYGWLALRNTRTSLPAGESREYRRSFIIQWVESGRSTIRKPMPVAMRAVHSPSAATLPKMAKGRPDTLVTHKFEEQCFSLHWNLRNHFNDILMNAAKHEGRHFVTP